ncbi:hypothetical protein N5K27_10565 [Pigmentiphaga sp. GD03639]|uniref:hypothetical protein n=1 Tax=Pigmentiphaga sp. GD03639 TaxID=2975354 RepID=UPI00244C6B84|nr:hypothetical protein [Pigmentiphaga sp. GD03639]MDH2236741.1 hypothetical protein [Pigmentiphaga sp. GD03639]
MKLIDVLRGFRSSALTFESKALHNVLPVQRGFFEGAHALRLFSGKAFQLCSMP